MGNKQVEGKNVETTIQKKIDQRHQFFNELAQAESDFKNVEEPIQELKSKLAQTQLLLSDKISQRGVVVSGQIKQIDPKLEKEIKDLTVQIEGIESEISKQFPDYEEKKERIANMKLEARSAMSVTQDDLVYFRQKISSKNAQIDKIETAIEENKILIKAENKALEKHQELCEQKENLLACLAINQEDSKALDGINEQLAKIEKQIEEQQKESMAYTSGKAQTISGLKRMLDAEKTERDKLEVLFDDLMNYHLLWRAEQIGAEYVKAAQIVEESYKKLFGIEVVLETLNNRKDRPSILGNACQQLRLPSFPIKGCEAKNDSEGFLFSFENGGDFIDKAFAAEAERLAELGVCQIQ